MLAMKIQESATELLVPSTDGCELALGIVLRDLPDQRSGSWSRNCARRALVVHKLDAHTSQMVSSSGPVHQFNGLFALTSDNRRLLGLILYPSNVYLTVGIYFHT